MVQDDELEVVLAIKINTPSESTRGHVLVTLKRLYGTDQYEIGAEGSIYSPTVSYKIEANKEDSRIARCLLIDGSKLQS